MSLLLLFNSKSGPPPVTLPLLVATSATHGDQAQEATTQDTTTVNAKFDTTSTGGGSGG